MDKLDEQAWELYKTRLTLSELADEALCEALRTTTAFALCRLGVALRNFGNALVSAVQGFWKG